MKWWSETVGTAWKNSCSCMVLPQSVSPWFHAVPTFQNHQNLKLFICMPFWAILAFLGAPGPKLGAPKSSKLVQKLWLGPPSTCSTFVPFYSNRFGLRTTRNCKLPWGQKEEPQTEQFAMTKEKLAIQIFPIFIDCKWIFLAWGLEWHINVYCGCQKYSSFHFFLQILVIFRSQFLTFEPCLEPMMLSKIFKCQFL